MASAKFITPFLKSTETLETTSYDLSQILIISGFSNPLDKLNVSLDGEYDGLSILKSRGLGTRIEITVNGQLYYEKVGIVISEDVRPAADSFVEAAESISATAYVKIISYTGKFSSQPNEVQDFQNLTKSNWQEIKSGTTIDTISFVSDIDNPNFWVGSSTGYVRVDFWDGESISVGDGTIFDVNLKLGLFEVSKKDENVSPLRKVCNVYSTDSLGNKSGNLTGIEINTILSIIFICPELIYLYINRSEISSINLIKLTKLTNIQLSDNSLKSLDISNQKQLSVLNISNNRDITSIDFTGLSDINSIQISDSGIISTDLDNFLISLNEHTKTKGGELNLSLDQWISRTAASDAAVISLTGKDGKGWNISTK